MGLFEYKVLLVPYKTSVFQTDNNEIQDALNAAGADRWRLQQLVLPSTVWGRSNTMIAIFERSKA